MLQSYASKLKVLITTPMDLVLPLCMFSLSQFARMQKCKHYNHQEQIVSMAEYHHKFALHMKKRHRHDDIAQVQSQ